MFNFGIPSSWPLARLVCPPHPELLPNSHRSLKTGFWKLFSLRTGQRTTLMREQPLASMHFWSWSHYPYWPDRESQVKSQDLTYLKSLNKPECCPQTSQDFSFQPAVVIYIGTWPKATQVSGRDTPAVAREASLIALTINLQRRLDWKAKCWLIGWVFYWSEEC